MGRRLNVMVVAASACVLVSCGNGSSRSPESDGGTSSVTESPRASIQFGSLTAVCRKGMPARGLFATSRAAALAKAGEDAPIRAIEQASPNGADYVVVTKGGRHLIETVRSHSGWRVSTDRVCRN